MARGPFRKLRGFCGERYMRRMAGRVIGPEKGGLVENYLGKKKAGGRFVLGRGNEKGFATDGRHQLRKSPSKNKMKKTDSKKRYAQSPGLK